MSHRTVSPTSGICGTCLKSYPQGANHVYLSNANARDAVPA